VIDKKRELEGRFRSWATGTNSPEQYQSALDGIEKSMAQISKLSGIVQYFDEAIRRGVETVDFARLFNNYLAVGMKDGVITDKEPIKARMATLYKDFNQPTDRRVAKRMFALVREGVPAEYHPSFYAEIDSIYGGDIDKFVDNLFDNSMFASHDKFSEFLENFSVEAFRADPAVKILISINEVVVEPMVALMPYEKALKDWQRVYMKGLMAMDPAGKFYPDANFTIRLTYGQVLPYSPKDGVKYEYYTTLKGVLEKEDASNPLEFTVPDRIKEAYAAGDYGRWGQDGELRINFLSNNDITGGNSGSPVLNGRGELIGLAFDGNWEALSSDVMFDANLQRCINLDIRYLLWTIDKFAGAGYLLDEMTIVE
jgi:hypothetical protein